MTRRARRRSMARAATKSRRGSAAAHGSRSVCRSTRLGWRGRRWNGPLVPARGAPHRRKRVQNWRSRRWNGSLVPARGAPRRRKRVQNASDAISPVRMRTTFSSAATKILPVADFAGPGRGGDGLDDLVEPRVVDRDLELDLRKEVHHVLRAPIELGVPLLPAESLDLGDGHSLNADLRQRRAHVVELERFDDRGDEMHGRLSLNSRWLL